MTIRYFSYFFLFSLSNIVYSQGPATWSSSQSYTHPALVISGSTTYISIQNVPVGILITNTTYWSTLDSLTPDTPPSAGDNLTTPDSSDVNDLTTPDSAGVSGTSTQDITLPHQGRVFISGTPFDGQGSFRFGLVNSAGEIVWNHTGASGVPNSNLSIQVSKGFYTVNLGDTSIAGMGSISADYFDVRNPLKLRIWFDDGDNGMQQLGQDHNLRISPYAISSLSESKENQNWGTLANPYGWDGEPIVGNYDDNYTVPEGKVLLIMAGTPFVDGYQVSKNPGSCPILGAGSVVQKVQADWGSRDGTFYGLLFDENPLIEIVMVKEFFDLDFPDRPSRRKLRYIIPNGKYLVVTSHGAGGSNFLYMRSGQPWTELNNVVSHSPAVFKGNGTDSIILEEYDGALASFTGYLISSENLRKLR